MAIVVLSTYLVNSLFDFSAYPTLGFIIQVIVVTFVILLAGEIIPKLYANRSQLNMVIFMAGPLDLFITPVPSAIRPVDRFHLYYQQAHG